jgi:asparagine synthase (glutamine-hydrolysing)
MSAIVGILKEPGVQVTEAEIKRLLEPTAQYAVGPSAVYVRNRIGVGFQPHPTHERSALETGPVFDSYRSVICFDGRIDNHEELSEALGPERTGSSDSKIVLAAFRRWGAECFARLCGDWAVSLWSEREQTLYLARDHAGTRTLYYCRQNGAILWSTHLDALLHTGAEIKLSESYMARYLTGSLIGDWTPYEAIRTVLPAHYHTFQDDVDFAHAHWSPATSVIVQHNNDGEYEQQFLSLFLQAVERRTGPGAPILAELSGGMDSTSIVCASDYLRRRRDSAAELLDTVSYYDDSESSLDERRYFAITEERRGKAGVHLEMAFSDRTFSPHTGTDGVYPLPGSDSLSIVRERSFHESVWKRGYHSILSGIGGDELLGGVPDPYPELSGYLMCGSLQKLWKQGVAWSLVDREPLLWTLAHTVRYTAEVYTRSVYASTSPQWLGRRLRGFTNSDARTWKEMFLRRKNSPRELDNERTWWAVMETLPHLFPRLLSRPEYRYPYLDKDLVNFLHGVPVDQLRRPGRRRSLMRRALVGVVPEEILERRRKAFQLGGPMRALRENEQALDALFAESICADLDFIEMKLFNGALDRARAGDATEWQLVLRVIALELWLRSSSSIWNRPERTGDEGLAA